MELLLAAAGEPEIMDETEKARLWELLLHSEKDFSGRTNFFLVAESVLLLAYGIVITQPVHSGIVFIIGGLALSLTWLVLQIKTVSDLGKLYARIKDADVSKNYLAWRAECKGFVVSHEIIAIVIPTLCLIGWFLVAAFNY